MGLKKWDVSKIDKALAKDLAEECGVDPIVALIASSRGYTDPTDLEQFLSEELCFSDPAETADIFPAAELVRKAVANGDKIAVYGDYDCDGVTAAALLYRYLISLGADCCYYIPDRFEEGYGMNCAAVDKLHAHGVNLIITVDNGITAFEEIAHAKSLGMKVVVTDHHLPGDRLPDADAVVDPHRADCPSSFKEICGAQVAFRLICVMENKEPEELLPDICDILCLAVIGDIMPLTLENRSIVKQGLHKLMTSPAVGPAALISVAGIDRDKITSRRVAFGLVPRINAAGRMGKAERGVQLLCCEDMMTALGLATEIDEENVRRQQTEQEIWKEAVRTIEENGLFHDRVIVCAGKNWHHGVVGIVAAKITERYGKPAILISVDDNGIAHGSGRSIEGFSLFEAIADSAALLLKFGGHDQAAGISLTEENIGPFRKSINDYAFVRPYAVPVLHIDCRLHLSALNPDLAAGLKALEPYGNGNPLPVFGLYGVTLQQIIPLSGGRHLRLVFSKENESVSTLLFGVSQADFCFETGDVLDLAVTAEENVYKGEVGISIQIKSMRPAGTDDEKLFSELAEFEAMCAVRPFNKDALHLDRNSVGTVYKYISEKPVLPERIKYHFLTGPGAAVTLAALRTLEELKLIALDETGRYTAVKGAAKTELTLSETYKSFMKGAVAHDIGAN